MNKLIALPAIALAAALATTAPASAAPQWAQMPAGQAHRLRKTYPIRSQERADWPTKMAVTLKKGSYDPACKWDRPVPSLDAGKLIITDSGGGLALQVIYKNGVIVNRPLSEGSHGGKLTYLYSTPTDDWNYFVLLKDTKPGAAEKTMIDKWYEVELFPPKGYSKACDPQRPDAAITIARAADDRPGSVCEAGTGGGGEPNH